MRLPLLLSILLTAMMGACSERLTSDMTGAGGAGRATGGGAGGAHPGAGGLGGSSVAPLCDTLIAEYQSAATAAEGCQVGASGQCQQVAGAYLSDCTCPIYFTDSAALTTIRQAWQAAGCGSPAPPCVTGCPAALNTTCVSIDGGSTGFCSYLPGTGGTSGAGGAMGGTSGAGGSPVDGGLGACAMFATEYAAVLSGARSCTAGTAAQCAQQVPSSLSPCLAGCTEFVTDSSVLDAIQREWDAANCGAAITICPLIGCLQATGAVCAPSDAGGSVCSTSYQ
jgi:hypothetical protein